MSLGIGVYGADRYYGAFGETGDLYANRLTIRSVRSRRDVTSRIHACTLMQISGHN